MQQHMGHHRVRYLVWIFLGIGIAMAPWDRAERSKAHAPVVELDPEQYQKLGDQYHIRVIISGERFPIHTQTGSITGRSANEENLAQYQSHLDSEIRLYPTWIFQRVGIQRLVLCEGLAYREQVRAAIPSWETATLYLDVRHGAHHQGYQIWVLHHELFHIIDFRNDGQLNPDPQWEALNGPTFTYGGGGALHQEYVRGREPRTAGFVRMFARAAVEEDKAETYAMLMVAPVEMARRTASDGILQAKVELLQSRLGRHGLGLDRQFWSKLSQYREDHPVSLPLHWLP